MMRRTALETVLLPIVLALSLLHFGCDGDSCKACKPNCKYRECGDDGCGMVCGKCQYPRMCMRLEVVKSCYNVEIPVCHMKQCGDDTYGGSCGYCPEGFICDSAALCQPEAGGCDGIPPEGICMDGVLVTCEGGSALHRFCAYEGCMVDDVTGDAYCAEVECLPDCFGKTCGDDGCGGSCGECDAGENCDQNLNICLPEGTGCGDIPKEGVCLGHVLVKCRGDTLDAEECLPQGLVCGVDECSPNPKCLPAYPGTPCMGAQEWGHCVNGHLFKCYGDKMSVEHCEWLGYRECDRTGLQSYGCRTY